MVSPPKAAPVAILIVDDDLGFLVWLGLTLSAGGFVTVPATSAFQARQLVQELGIRINLAIVNPGLPDTSDLASSMKQRDAALKVIAIQASSFGPSLAPKADASHSRSKLGWITLVRRILGIERATGAR